MGKGIMINCDYLFYIKAGSKPGMGLGHLRRSLAIASVLKKKTKKIFFVVKGEKSATDILRQKGFKCALYSKIILNLLRPRIVVIDQKDDVSGDIRSFKTKGSKICLVDNTTKARFLADIVLYPLSHLDKKMGWKGFKGKKLIGAKYFPLNPEFLKARRIKHRSFNILVTMGGADPNKLASKVAKALKLIQGNIKVVFVFGAVSKRQSIPNDKRFSIVRDPSNMAQLMARSDIALTAFGTTLYELAYMGVPAVIINNFRGDAADTRSFKKLGTSVPLGYHKNISSRTIVNAVVSLMKNRKNLLKLSFYGKKLVDGKGTQRIVKMLRNI